MKKERKNQPPRKKKRKSSPPVHTISCGSELHELLEALNKKGFQVNTYSDNKKIPRSTTRSRIRKLDRLGMIHFEPFYTHILDIGINYLKELEISKKGGTKVSRTGGRKNQLSSHWKSFTIPIKDRRNFYSWRLNSLDCKWRENKGMTNWTELIASFDDATVTIKPNKVVIHLNDIVTNTIEESERISIQKLIKYVEKMMSAHIILEEVSLERGHWARIDSDLANYIYDRTGDKYYLKLSNGSTFTVDCSIDKFGNRKIEGETTEEEQRENLDNFMDPILMGKYKIDDLNDIDKIKESLCLVNNSLKKITTMEGVRLEHHIEENKLKRAELESLKKNENTRQDLNTVEVSYIC